MAWPPSREHRRSGRRLHARARADRRVATPTPRWRASDAATVGGLRAFGDRLALRQRFHDHAHPSAHRPAEHRRPRSVRRARARAARRARRAVAGGRRAEPARASRRRERRRALAGVRSVQRPRRPGRKQATVGTRPRGTARRADRRACAPSPATSTITVGLPTAAAAWAEQAAGTFRSRPLADAWKPRRTTARASRRRHPPRPLRATRLARGAAQEGDGARARPGRRRRPARACAAADERCGYRAYTTAFDRVVNAAALASRDELAQLRAKLEAEMSGDARRGRAARQAADARADGEAGARVAVRSRRGAARRVAARAVRRQPRRRAPVQAGKRLAVSEHGR